MITNTQFTTRNQNELADILITFRDLNTVCDKQLILSLEQDFWEIFDLRACNPIYRCPFKHIKGLKDFMVRLKQDILNVHMASVRSRPTSQEVSSIKRLHKLFGAADYIFTNNLISYIYGQK